MRSHFSILYTSVQTEFLKVRSSANHCTVALLAANMAELVAVENTLDQEDLCKSKLRQKTAKSPWLHSMEGQFSVKEKRPSQRSTV